MSTSICCYRRTGRAGQLTRRYSLLLNPCQRHGCFYPAEVQAMPATPASAAAGEFPLPAQPGPAAGRGRRANPGPAATAPGHCRRKPLPLDPRLQRCQHRPPPATRPWRPPRRIRSAPGRLLLPSAERDASRPGHGCDHAVPPPDRSSPDQQQRAVSGPWLERLTQPAWQRSCPAAGLPGGPCWSGSASARLPLTMVDGCGTTARRRLPRRTWQPSGAASLPGAPAVASAPAADAATAVEIDPVVGPMSTWLTDMCSRQGSPARCRAHPP